MAEQEGVIQYHLDFVHKPLDDSFKLDELNVCRTHLYALGLIGQDAGRYAGLGFGNISQRAALPGNPDAFLVTGSQTGYLPVLERRHYTLVTQCEPQQNRLQASGETAPSSESMTHAVVYQSLPAVQAIIHVHWPALWQNAAAKGLLVTARDIPYGTPPMAAAVQAILRTHNTSTGVLAMLGHEDGILAWGTTLAEAQTSLLRYND
jgi:ribulose-5-phosphate 4-epimerase/fuculose-1-phosphate aldolase